MKQPTIAELEHELRQQDEEATARCGGQAAMDAFNLADCPHPNDDRAPLSGDEWICIRCQSFVEPPDSARGRR